MEERELKESKEMMRRMREEEREGGAKWKAES